MRRILKILTSKLPLVAVLVLVQLFLLFAYVYKLVFVRGLFPTLQILSIILVLGVINRIEDPSYKLAWTIAILFVPVIGIPLYFMAADRKMPKKIRNGTINASNKLYAMLEQDRDVYKEALEDGQGRLLKYAEYTEHFPFYKDTETTFYSSGEEWFPHYMEALRSAEHFIFIEMFIIEEGSVWNEIHEVLKQKAKEGVDVKLIYDDFGSVTMGNLFRQLRKEGIESYSFNRLKPALIFRMNNRDHRKITVIDNKVAFTGGVNLSDEYVNRIKRFGYWKDSALRIAGPAVWSMSVQFLGMYHYLSRSKDDRDYSCYKLPSPLYDTEGFVQPFADSPTDGHYVGMTEHLNLINNAQRYVYINTPYLILNDSVSRALKIAARNGVDVRILVPHIPDKILVFQCTRGNYKELLDAGVKIYEFMPGFNHSKAIVIDDTYALVGSINTDYRSYFLHFEDGVLMYKTDAIWHVREDFEHSLALSHEVTSEEERKTNIFLRILRGILRVFMPLI